MNNANMIEIKDRTGEFLFKLTFFITIVHAGFIFWDFLTLIQPFNKFAGIIEENSVYSSGSMSTLYLAILGIYAGRKEIKRWTQNSGIEIAEQQSTSNRGEFIVGTWVVFTVVTLVFQQLHIISRMPHELFRTALQVIGVIFGTYTSRDLHKRKKGGIQNIQDSNLQSKDKIIEFIKSNGFIDNASCQKLLNLDRNKAYILLNSLEKEGVLVQEGSRKGSIYKLSS